LGRTCSSTGAGQAPPQAQHMLLPTCSTGSSTSAGQAHPQGKLLHGTGSSTGSDSAIETRLYHRD